jgi:hypothetical protein
MTPLAKIDYISLMLVMKVSVVIDSSENNSKLPVEISTLRMLDF